MIRGEGRGEERREEEKGGPKQSFLHYPIIHYPSSSSSSSPRHPHQKNKEKDDKNQRLLHKIIDFAQLLGGFSITFSELRYFFKFLEGGGEGGRVPTQYYLLRALHRMCIAKTRTPGFFFFFFFQIIHLLSLPPFSPLSLHIEQIFTFDGLSSALSLPPIPFPLSSGYSFCTWLRIESFKSPRTWGKSGKNDNDVKPAMFYLVSFFGEGIALNLYLKRFLFYLFYSFYLLIF